MDARIWGTVGRHLDQDAFKLCYLDNSACESGLGRREGVSTRGIRLIFLSGSGKAQYILNTLLL